ncbi:hypothetical protein BLNAU_16810 [Blattamonas nauphoetae]|uniref:Uncharacterized protein n=1 Tax=Blattamonas nauphoetae TaxID=2049346 RepID=A0ABQ9X9A9_9EUKA|nr:hypothetical protein BLNAU_16810 [Blattamonas nauphoetae]
MLLLLPLTSTSSSGTMEFSNIALMSYSTRPESPMLLSFLFAHKQNRTQFGGQIGTLESLEILEEPGPNADKFSKDGLVLR